MDLLKFGMENEKSRSPIRRMLGKGALAAEKKKADVYDEYLERKISVPEDAAGADALLKKIQEEISDKDVR